MKKITTLALIVCSAFVFSACSLQKNNTQPISKIETKKAFSIKDLMSQNIAQKCTWQIINEQGTTTGEMLIKGKKFKQSVNVKTPNTENKIYGISDGEWYYYWSDDSTVNNTAFKMKMDLNEEESEGDDYQVSTGNIDLNQEYDYNCQPTTLTDSDLSLPAGVIFQDLSNLNSQFQQ